MTAGADDPAEPEGTPKPDATGTNARPRDATLAQSGDGIPDDSGRPVQIDEAEAQRIEKKIHEV